MKNLTSGTLIAIAAGGLFFSACKKEEPAKNELEPKKAEVAPTDKADPAEKTAEKIDCGGINECKGQGTCKGENHGCGGQNECKGKGVLSMTEEECKAKGGTVVANK